MVEEEGGGEAQWRVRVWVSGKELEVDDEEEDESVGNDCSGFAFMTGPFGRNRSLEWEKVGAWFEFLWEEEDNVREREFQVILSGSGNYYVEYILSSCLSHSLTVTNCWIFLQLD